MTTPETRTETAAPHDEPALKPALADRQMSMIAIGGVIGAGLFVGSGSVIKSAGPAALVSYAASGLLVVLVMRMLAELSVTTPATGSFAAYASRELGSWAGLAIGWMYAYSWSVTVGVEAVVGGGLVHRLLPDVPGWSAALLFMVVLTGANLVAVRAYGESEFWFALVKVIAIVLFIVLGVLAIAGLMPGVDAPGTTNLLHHGGFAPHGWYAVVPAALVVMFALNGAEVVTIAAGEAVRPAEAVRKAVRSTVTRILIFYIGSVAVIVTLLPHDSASVTSSPYAAVLDTLGIPHAGTAMDVIVLIAVLSCLNSGIYTSSRMMFALAANGEAPRFLGRTNRHGVPVAGVLLASIAGFVTVCANYFVSTTAVFDFLVNSSGSVIVLLYLTITITQLRARARADREGFVPAVRMWGHPYLSWLIVLVLGAMLIFLATHSDTRRSLTLTLSVTAIAVLAGAIRQSRRRSTS
ncbi:amino acid permease [Actinomadura harenae]|uniref:Amino acid permease n=1 Tax=Actinomadura harenae TaxID=2483351 RepID=A0A3M2LKA0_9ACTN|nr:amino acid permease [Actinomadura harenae]RMI37909.1 amino acid permease [Actinomadura harenae]